MNMSRKKNALHLDPRTFLFLLLLGNLAVFVGPSLVGEMGLMLMILLLAIGCGVFKFPVKMTAVYFVFVLIDFVSIQYGTGLWVYLALFFRFLRKVMPCGLLGIILIQTTKVGSFMAALSKMKVPKKIMIPLTVMLRYFPAIREDYQRIKKAMKMRGITPGIKSLFTHPSMTIECIYVPIMMSASRRADELSAAAITRGIENPNPRTSLEDVSLKWVDYLVMLLFILGVWIIWRTK